MSVSVVDDGTELTIDCEYATDLFDRARITRMFGHFENMLRAAAADPSVRLSELPMLSEEERADLLTRWQGVREDSDHRPVPDRIAAIAAAHPDKVAVRFNTTDLSYTELMRRADALAAWLRARGVGREDIVAVAMHRGIDVIVAVGRRAARGRRLPDGRPGPSEARLEFILGDAGRADRADPDAVRRAAARRRPYDAVHGRRLGADQRRSAPGTISEDDLAYVLYTSGSTGKPKGVAIEHHALNTFVHWLGGILQPEDRILQHMSLIFDLADGVMLSALSTGCTLVVLPEERRGDPRAYTELLTTEHITFVAGPPAPPRPGSRPATTRTCDASCPAARRCRPSWPTGGAGP